MTRGELNSCLAIDNDDVVQWGSVPHWYITNSEQLLDSIVYNRRGKISDRLYDDLKELCALMLQQLGLILVCTISAQLDLPELAGIRRELPGKPLVCTRFQFGRISYQRQGSSSEYSFTYYPRLFPDAVLHRMIALSARSSVNGTW